MSFDLCITFAGLCTLVDDQTALQVLLPTTAGHDHNGAVHVPTLYYEPQHAPDHVPGEVGLRSRPLGNRLLDLSSLQSAAEYEPGLPTELFDMDTITRVPLKRSLLINDGGGKLTSRVVVDAGGYINCDPGGRWMISDIGPRFMAIAVEWKVPAVNADHLSLSLEPLNGSGNVEVLELNPINGRVEMAVFHTPADDVPTGLPPQRSPVRPAVGYPAKHFRAFYALVDPPAPNQPVPTYYDDGSASGRKGGLPILGTKVECIATQASMEPA